MMKRILAALCCILLCFSGASAETPRDGKFQYKVLADGTACITSYLGDATELTIPTVLDGYQVSQIGPVALSNLPRLEAVRIPEGVTAIGTRAFLDCFSLRSVKLPEGLQSIGREAFFGCDSLLEVTLPEGLTNLGWNAFASCKSLRTVHLPASLETVDINPFVGCHALTDIDVSGKNRRYEVVDGLLYDREEKRLVCCPAGLGLTECTVADGTEIIGVEAFYGIVSLEKVTLPDSLRVIEKEAFWGSCQLEWINLPRGLTEIADSVFALSDGLCLFVEPGTLGAEYAMGWNIGWAFPEPETPAQQFLYEVYDQLTYVSPDDQEIYESGDFAYVKYKGGAQIVDIYSRLTHVEFPETIDGLPVISIGGQVFMYLNHPEEIYIGKHITHIDSNPFFQMNAKVTIAPDHPVLEVEDGVLYNKAEKRMVGILDVGAFADPEHLKVREGTEIIGRLATNGYDFERVTLPDSVTRIEANAFLYNGSLEHINLPEGLRYIGPGAFYHTGLTGVKIPAGVEFIPYQAFGSCYYLENLDLGQVKIIGESVFGDCWALSELSIPDTVTHILPYAFSCCGTIVDDHFDVKFGSGLEEICHEAFAGCESLPWFTLPEGVTSIGAEAFDGCWLDHATLPASLQYIGPNAIPQEATLFVKPGTNADTYAKENGNRIEYPKPEPITSGAYEYVLLEDGTAKIVYEENNVPDLCIPAELDGHPVSTIGWNAMGYSYFTSVTVPEGVTSIESHCFMGCENLESITLPSTLTELGPGAFEGCTALKSIVIPEGVTRIGSDTFARCKSLETVHLPQTVTVILSNAFRYCESLREIHLPEGLNHIGNHAFAECESLTALTIPESVTYVGRCAFDYCPVTLTVTPGSPAEELLSEYLHPEPN